MNASHVTAALLLSVVGTSAALGQSKEWDGGGGSTDWFNGDNWDPDGVPGSGDAVIVQGVVPVAQAADIDVRSLLVDTGLVLDSRSMILAEPSTITNFTLQGCCTRSVTTQALLTLNGVTTLSKGTIFGGPGGVRIAGVATSAEIVRANGTQVTIAGSLVASGNVEPWSGGVVDVVGTLAMRAPGDLDEVSGGQTVLSAGGQIGILGTTTTDQVTVDARLEAGAGTLFADRGILDLRGEYDLEFTTVEANDGGQVWLTGSFPNEIENVTFQGDGTVELRNANNTYKGALTSSMTPFGRGLELFGTTRLDGILTNTGHMTLGTLLTSPAGTGRLITRGRLNGSGTTEIPIAVFDGGILELAHQVNMVLKANVDVFSGGELVLGSGEGSSTVSAPSSGSVGRVVCEGTLRAYNAMNCAQTTQVVSAPVDLMPGALVTCESGELVLNGGGNWSGGTIAPEGTCLSLVSVNGFNVTHTISGDVLAKASPGNSVTFGGNGHTLNVTGTLRTEGLAENPIPGISLIGRTIGAGQIVHELETLMLGSNFDLGTTLINDARVKVDASIQVRGEIRNNVDGDQHATIRFEGGTLVNDGNWVVRAASDQQLGAGGTVTNTGVYQAGFAGAGGFGHRVFARFGNSGVVVAHDANMELHDVAQIVDDALTGGGWVTLGTGSISFPGTSMDTIRGSGTIVDGDTTRLPWLDGVTDVEDGATVNVTDDAVFGAGLGVDDGSTLGVGEGVEVDVGGDLDLKSVTADLEPVILLALRGGAARIVASETRSHGRIIPGAEGRAGAFEFVGNVTQYGDGQLLVDVGDEEADSVSVTGSAMLDGTLVLSHVGGHVPALGETHVVLSAAGGVVGTFASLDAPSLGPDLVWVVDYAPTEVTVRVGARCAADWNGDEIPNTADFVAYLNDFNAVMNGGAWTFGDPDIAAPIGVLNTADFVRYLNAYVGGCD